MRVVVLHPGFETVYGAERVALELAEHLGRVGHDVTVCSTSRPTGDAAPIRFQVMRSRGVARWINHKDWRIASIGRQLKPIVEAADCVLAHNYPTLRWLEHRLTLLTQQVATVMCTTPLLLTYGQKPLPMSSSR